MSAKVTKIQRVCAYCGDPFLDYPSHHRTYCCRAHATLGRRARMPERFWSYVDIRLPHECWPWLRSTDKDGYGTFEVEVRKERAHRVAYLLTHGWDSIPPGFGVLHTCDNPPCCNPAHLWAGTVAENNADRNAKGHYIPRIGEQSPLAKLAEAQVREIRARRAANRTPLKVLAEEYGVTDGTIEAIVYRFRWKHID